MNCDRLVLNFLILLTFVFFHCTLQLSRCDPSANSKIIFTDESGNTITLNDLANTDTPDSGDHTYNYQIYNEDNVIPARARELHEQGRVLGSQGQSQEAIDTLKEANKVAPDWPYPLYDIAFTYLMQGDNKNAMKYYEKVVKLVPDGFFTSAKALWSLQEELKGTFPEGLYLAYVSIEWTQDVTQKYEIARQIVDKYPMYCPAWKDVYIYTNDDDEKRKALEQGIRCKGDINTMETMNINYALQVNVDGDKDKAIEILGNMILNEKTTTASKVLAKSALSTMIDTKDEL